MSPVSSIKLTILTFASKVLSIVPLKSNFPAATKSVSSIPLLLWTIFKYPPISCVIVYSDLSPENTAVSPLYSSVLITFISPEGSSLTLI